MFEVKSARTVFVQTMEREGSSALTWYVIAKERLTKRTSRRYDDFRIDFFILSHEYYILLIRSTRYAPVLKTF